MGIPAHSSRRHSDRQRGPARAEKPNANVNAAAGEFMGDSPEGIRPKRALTRRMASPLLTPIGDAAAKPPGKTARARGQLAAASQIGRELKA